MRIPHVSGTFGQRGPDRQGPLNPDTRGMTAGHEGAARLGAGIVDAAQTINAQLAREQRMKQAEAEQLAEAKAANAILNDELQTKQFGLDLTDRVNRGEVSWQAAREEYETWQSQREAPQIDGLPPPSMERFRGGLMRNRAAGQFIADRVADEGRRVEFQGVVGQTRETLAKMAADPNADLAGIEAYGTALREKAVAAGVGEQFDKTQQAWVDRLYYDNANAVLNTVRESPEGLKALEEAVSSEGGRYFGKLDADKQNAIMGRIATYRTQLDARKDRLVDRKEAEADRAIDRLQNYEAEGLYPPADELEDLRGKIAGSSREGEWNARVQGLGEAQQLAKLPPAQQLRFVEEQEAKLSTGTLSLEEASNIRRMRSVVEARVKELATDPLGYDAKVTGTTVPPLDLQAMVAGDVDALRAQVEDRMAAVSAVRKRYQTGVGTSPLRPQEASALSTALAQAAPKQALQVYSSLRGAFDAEAYQAVMQQIAPDAPVRAYAGQVHALGGDKVARQLLEGEALLKPKDKGTPYRIPGAATFNDALVEELGTAFAGRPEDLKTAMQAVRAHYAATASDAGDATDELDADRLRESVRAVVGDRAEVGDVEVIPPWGMDADTFEDKAEAFIEARLQAAGVEDPGNVGLMNLRGRPGVYLLVRKGMALNDRNGVPMLIRMKP